MIITTGFSKGGTSKTTLSVEIALAAIYHGYRCVIIDADRQKSATNFSALRERRRGVEGFLKMDAPRLPVVTSDIGKPLENQIKNLGGTHDLVIVDTPGLFSEDLVRAMSASDLLLMPVAASAYETWPLEVIARSVSEIARKNPAIRALIVPMRLDEEVAQAEREAIAAVVSRANVGAMITARSRVCYRRAFREAHNFGMSVAERGIEGAKARADIFAVWKEIEALGRLAEKADEARRVRKRGAYLFGWQSRRRGASVAAAAAAAAAAAE